VTGSSDVTAARAALERGRGVLIVAPPAVEQARLLWDLLPSGPAAGGVAPRTLIITADADAAVAWASAAPAGCTAHPVTGFDRTLRLLAHGQIDVLAGTPADLAALTARGGTGLKLETVAWVVLAWPEAIMATAQTELLDTLLTQMPDAKRIVLSWNPAALESFLERHAPRAHLVGDLPLDADGRPPRPVGPARYALVTHEGRSAATREALDALDRPDVYLWHRGTTCPQRTDAVLCLDLPTRGELEMIAASGPVVLLLSPGQLAYARAIAAPLSALPLPAAARAARTAGDALRAEITARLDQGNLEPEMALLEPLLARHDAVEVAAAVLALRPGGGGAAKTGAPQPAPTGAAATPEFAKLFVNVGRKDRVGAKDLVGALTREIGLARDQIGRIVVRDAFSVVEVAPGAAERAAQGLCATTIRSRRVQARPYREA